MDYSVNARTRLAHLFLGAVRPLLGDDHDPLVLQHPYTEDRDPGAAQTHSVTTGTRQRWAARPGRVHEHMHLSSSINTGWAAKAVAVKSVSPSPVDELHRLNGQHSGDDVIGVVPTSTDHH